MFSNATVKILCALRIMIAGRKNDVRSLAKSIQSRTLWIMVLFGYKVKATDFQGPLLRYLLLIERMCLHWVQRILIIWTCISALKDVCPTTDLSLVCFISTLSSGCIWRPKLPTRAQSLCRRLKYTYPSTYQAFALIISTRNNWQTFPSWDNSKHLEAYIYIYIFNVEWKYVSNNW